MSEFSWRPNLKQDQFDSRWLRVCTSYFCLPTLYLYCFVVKPSNPSRAAQNDYWSTLLNLINYYLKKKCYSLTALWVFQSLVVVTFSIMDGKKWKSICELFVLDNCTGVHGCAIVMQHCDVHLWHLHWQVYMVKLKVCRPQEEQPLLHKGSWGSE